MTITDPPRTATVADLVEHLLIATVDHAPDEILIGLARLVGSTGASTEDGLTILAGLFAAALADLCTTEAPANYLERLLARFHTTEPACPSH